MDLAAPRRDIVVLRRIIVGRCFASRIGVIAIFVHLQRWLDIGIWIGDIGADMLRTVGWDIMRCIRKRFGGYRWVILWDWVRRKESARLGTDRCLCMVFLSLVQGILRVVEIKQPLSRSNSSWKGLQPIIIRNFRNPYDQVSYSLWLVSKNAVAGLEVVDNVWECRGNHENLCTFLHHPLII